jgi:alkylation response protein AidB-like acyl-CoA dehydrogenase
MDLELSDDQFALRDGVASLLAGWIPIERVREGFDRALFDELAGAGVWSLLDDGFGWADAVVVFEQLGRGCVPGPLTGSLLAHGSVGGIVGVADRPDPGAPAWVEHLDVLDALCVIDEDGVWRVDPAALDGEPSPWPLDPCTPIARVFELPRGERIASREVAAEWEARGAVLTAALQLGLADRLVEMAVEYAKDRRQFGRPIGSFQAIKHLLADMLVRVEVARAAVYAAGAHLDDPGLAGFGRAVAGAKALAGEAAIANGKAATQVHGGMGYTWEVDVHLYLKRAWVLDTHFGPAERQCDALAATLTG